MEQFDGLKVLVAGDVMLDEYIHGNVSRISPEAPVPVVEWAYSEEKLGGAANVALNLKMLGADVTVYTVMQEDDAGGKIQRKLDDAGISWVSEGINCIYPSVVVGPTTVKTRICAGNHQLCRVDRESPVHTRESGSKLPLDISEYKAIFVSDYAKGFVSPDLMDAIRVSGVPFYCDPKNQDLAFYRGAAAITPNEAEALAFYGGRNEFWDLYNDAERYGIETVLLTLGSAGAELRHNGDTTPIKPQKVELADACGAGDTAFAVFGLALASGFAPLEAANLAMRAAAETCRHFGVVPVTRLNLIANGDLEWTGNTD